MAEYRVLLRDTLTGREAWHTFTDVAPQDDPDGMVEFYWSDGNDGCDCNRLTYLLRALGEPDEEAACGNRRVVIVRAECDGRPLPAWGERD